MAAVITTDNSYVTLAEANTYFDNRLNITTWSSADDDTKTRALLQATRRLNYEKYYGDRVSGTQALPFPRINIGYIDGVLIDNTIPQQIKDAECELALYMLSTDMSKPSVNLSNIEEVQAGSVRVKYVADDNDNISRPNDELPPFVMHLLDGLSKTATIGGMVEVYR